MKNIEDVRPIFDRACPVDTVLACRCGNTHKELLHNACVGRENSEPFRTRYPAQRWKQVVLFWLRPPPPMGGQQCTIQNISSAMTSRTSGRDVPTNPDSASNRFIDMRVTPLAVDVVSSLEATLLRNVSERRQGEESDPHVKHADTPSNGNHPIVFEVEFTHALERRMRCSSLDNFLSECQLLECSQSAVLSTNMHSLYQFGGLSCVIPDRAVIWYEEANTPVPLCVCRRALSTLSRLDQWSAIWANQTGGSCSFQLSMGDNSMLMCVGSYLKEIKVCCCDLAPTDG